ncbi:MAG TPA: nucleotide sugar dehydrogenase [Thermotogota bacterium]|nr:nucleotide sugar dehydrogenase [Thermotogota bacterium]NLZ13205.1 nucleotide sugar dehydrogenase [Thermotogaceae bacterium]MDD8041154.1 nucleotide sugar dehydrogenase [Thermotogota bacterium]HNR63657.1 nucleotide sugar dehydrogenase [Thermotogota bacterium]HNT95915.1 nucleotide sugar dehydrogenase [Thermotogota bacterium]
MLIEKVEGRTAVIGVIGLGYVGLPLAVEKAKAGFTVIGFDIQEQRVKMVNEGHNYIGDVVNEDLEQLAKSGKLQATTDFESLRECDVVAICVPTPLDVFKQPDLSYVIRSTEEIAKRLHNDMLVVLESTTYPGTTEDVMKPILEETGLVCGKDFYLAFSPERVDPGNLRFKTKNTPKIVGGYGDLSTKIAKSLYEKVLDASVFTVSSPKEAEMAKVLENTFRIVNIALINEMAIVSERMGINLWEVIDAAATKPFGFMPFYPGPGVGGHCIPIDPFYLTYIARKYDYHTRLIEAAGEINDAMPQYVVERLMKLLNLERKCLNGAKIIMLGIAYKGDIDDMRESPALKVLELLEGAKAEVTVIDPYVTAFKWKDGLRKTDPLQRDQLGEADAVVITTAHKNGVDYRTVCEEARLVFDTKNILKTLDVDRSRVFVL